MKNVLGTNKHIKLPRVPIVIGRQDVIVSRCINKRVLHLGCADRGYLEGRFRSGELMHQKLASVSKELWGVDIDKEGIDFLKSQGFNNLLVGDICASEEFGVLDCLSSHKFDLIIASEILEHLQNPGAFFRNIKKIMIPEETELIVTVPNVFRIDNFINLLRGLECGHPDHYYWFSYYTAQNLLKKNNFDVKNVLVYSFQKMRFLPERRMDHNQIQSMENLGRRGSFLDKGIRLFSMLSKRFMVYFLLKRTPFWGDGIILIAKLSKNA